MAGPDAAFWQARFETGTTPWDRGAASPQLLRWRDEGVFTAGSTVLVPGCGSGWEVAELAAAGVEVTGLDYAAAAVDRSKQHLAERGLQAQVLQADVLQWSPTAPVDAVYEQTCLCALHPDHWTAYAAQLHAWLKPGGRLLALFMQAPAAGAPDGFVTGPPYHCDIHAMRALFPSSRWSWPKPPYARVNHPLGAHELALALTRL
ncbi:methyltransferase domain-containing protein [Variovorax ginsengisoli]|uniref:Methyltransferase domain-containing protein n=1 Tax=Variovorax ginsengisoli TaxID=363844 RepID=A0ABT8SA04_9BURK|nr:methyltransferase domain-containing protein [Variovorax ginsengisoli]MDN8616584.1 methyltransferase domain-containing protein [Variovorax ginsengisoli]MDO1535754.1 methyltransferase domain-containing protein [Variovorax ginsengisoli]